jgi:TonB family protein
MSHPLLHANTSFVFAVVVGSVVAVTLALLIERLARRTSTAARHALILTALLVPPVLAAAGAIGLGLPEPAPDRGPVEVKMLGVAPQQAAVTEREWPCILAMLWLAGAAVALIRTIAMYARWRGIAARATWFHHTLFMAPVDLAKSDEVREPAVIGIVDPVVVLPASYDLTADELRAVFAHELAHVDRRDNLAALFVQIACALFWFDPLHRIARRRLVELRERVVDDLVLARGCDAAAYVAALARSCETSLATTAACMSRLNLQERMESIMTPHTSRRWPVAITRAFIAVAVTLAAIAFATVAPAPQLSAGESTVTPATHDFDLRAMKHEDGRLTLYVRVNTPDGTFASSVAVPSAPDSRTITHTYAGKTYEIALNLLADGSVAAKLDVREGDKVLMTTARNFNAPRAAEKRAVRAAVTRVGDVANMVPPKPITRVEAIYPQEAKDARIAGVVILETLIDENGTVADVRVLKPLPFGLDKAAVEAVKQWRWEPATIDGKAVPVLFNLTMNFQLE